MTPIRRETCPFCQATDYYDFTLHLPVGGPAAPETRRRMLPRVRAPQLPVRDGMGQQGVGMR